MGSRKSGFTLIELLVVISIIALLLSILVPSLVRVREAGKRIVCLSNLKQLGLAFRMYAENNDDKIISSDIDLLPFGPPWWVGNLCPDDWRAGGQFPENVQIEKIKSGALWSYVEVLGAYRCPAGYPGELLTYAMGISMNGRSVNGSPSFKKMSEIPSPSSRLVFIDEGMVTPNAWSTRYLTAQWWDMPGNRHSSGNTFAFADGHAAYRKWAANETRQLGRLNPRVFESSYEPKTQQGIEDVQWAQRALWGKLGY